MFDRITQQIKLQALGKNKEEFSVTEQEFESFCKEFLFEQIKGEIRLGEAFCKKYSETNFVLSILPDTSAREHIKKFYVR